MDAGSLIGPIIAVGAIALGFSLEGGHLAALVQPSAAMMVSGGTFGAVLLHFPSRHLWLAFTSLQQVLSNKKPSMAALVKEMVDFSRQARREGIVVLENEAHMSNDKFLSQALLLAADGGDGNSLRDALNPELDQLDFEGQLPARVFEMAGGYAPTAGILGAVLGLVNVMSNLTEPSLLGSGIAVAFVATIYGVGSANLIFLPIAGKLRARHTDRMFRYELITEGMVAVAEGINPRALHQRLSSFVRDEEMPELYDSDPGIRRKAA